MVAKKHKSKRLTLKQKYKIEKKIKEHKRKQRRDERKNPHKRAKLKKEPGLPNIWPFKQEFLQKLELQKQSELEEKLRLAEARKRKNLATLSKDANKRAQEFEKEELKKEKEQQELEGLIEVKKDNSRRAFYREFKRIVELADVVLEVLDARDPLGCRCLDVEQRILTKDPNKKIILVLNKIDLVPKSIVEKWLKYLRNEFPTIAFKCSTQEKKISQNNRISFDVANSNLFQSNECLGADTLLQLLKNYCRNLNLKTSITVGIIGYPNVGKSSLINSLKRSKVAAVGSTPGLTKSLQEVHLDKNIKLLDCPGIVFGSAKAENDIILRNCIKVEQLTDPIAPIEAIIKRCKNTQLAKLYNIALFSDVQDFLLRIANKRGKLGKGGKPDLKAAARTVLQDWNEGKIPFYTLPPERKEIISTEIVSTWGKAFDIQSIIQLENNYISQLKDDSKEHMVIESSEVETHALGYESEEMEDKEEENEKEEPGEKGMEEDGEEEVGDPMVDEESILSIPKKPSSKPMKQSLLLTKEDEFNPQANRNLKLQQKKDKKKVKKYLKKRISTNEEEEEMSDIQQTGQAYNFDDYFKE